ADVEAGERGGGERLVRPEQVVAGKAADGERDGTGGAEQRLREHQKGNVPARGRKLPFKTFDPSRAHRAYRLLAGVGPDLPGDAVEHRVHQLRLLVLEERLCDLDIFRDDHGDRNVLALAQLEGAGAQDGAHGGI